MEGRSSRLDGAHPELGPLSTGLDSFRLTAKTLVRTRADAVHRTQTQLRTARVPGASLPAQWQSDRRVLQVNKPARRRAEWEMRSAARSVAIVFESRAHLLFNY